MKNTLKMNSARVTTLALLAVMALFTSCNDDDIESSDTDTTTGTDTSTYILVVDQTGQGADIINHDGDEIFSWDFDAAIGNDASLLDDGSMLVCLKDNDAAITFGGYGGVFQKINADQTTDWEVSYSTTTQTAHHDVEYLANGNIIFPVWEQLLVSDATEMGFSGSQDIYPEAIIEMNPVTQEIVWEWHATDHLIQDHDSAKLNYGTVQDNPNKIDINYNSAQANGDIMHMNGITIDETNNIIYVTINNYSEIWVIDHSTTTAQAATSTGGNYNLGGDLVYRFGNPLAYDNVGDVTINDVHYPNVLDTGNMLVFSNNIYDNQSAVFEYQLNPPYQLVAGEDNEPELVWSFTNSELYSAGLGGAVRTPNGNTLIAEGRDGTVWEVSDSGEVLWKYAGYDTLWRVYAIPVDDDRLSFLGVN
ncbi:arylsulfotransferase family protein [Winogradskyella helgolandensis]|uniref:arylsulfotransferase family protein n=1 Tax=Winogradskyella helgolandensis TaxID=2697010 RepID=UPI001FD0C9F6|nr:aryl-sulfate sulfotransferase [Winogradskyella helgolandensis]